MNNDTPPTPHPSETAAALQQEGLDRAAAACQQGKSATLGELRTLRRLSRSPLPNLGRLHNLLRPLARMAEAIGPTKDGRKSVFDCSLQELPTELLPSVDECRAALDVILDEEARLLRNELDKNVPASAKPLLKGLTRDNPATPEGKYLVKRRDGTVVEWPCFVLGARDPFAEIALIAYYNAVWARIHANNALVMAGQPVDPKTEVTAEFANAIKRLAETFAKYREEHGQGDPGRGKHRKDDPATVEEMRKGHSA